MGHRERKPVHLRKSGFEEKQKITKKRGQGSHRGGERKCGGKRIPGAKRRNRVSMGRWEENLSEEEKPQNPFKKLVGQRKNQGHRNDQKEGKRKCVVKISANKQGNTPGGDEEESVAVERKVE